MFVLPELLVDSLRREHDRAVEQHLEQRRLAVLARAVAECCRRSAPARIIGAMRLPLAGPRATS